MHAFQKYLKTHQGTVTSVCWIVALKMLMWNIWTLTPVTLDPLSVPSKWPRTKF